MQARRGFKLNKSSSHGLKRFKKKITDVFRVVCHFWRTLLKCCAETEASHATLDAAHDFLRLTLSSFIFECKMAQSAFFRNQHQTNCFTLNQQQCVVLWKVQLLPTVQQVARQGMCLQICFQPHQASAQQNGHEKRTSVLICSTVMSATLPSTTTMTLIN